VLGFYYTKKTEICQKIRRKTVGTRGETSYKNRSDEEIYL